MHMVICEIIIYYIFLKNDDLKYVIKEIKIDQSDFENKVIFSDT